MSQHGDSLGGGELEPESKFRSTASYNWESSGPAEDTDDFFSSLVSGNEVSGLKEEAGCGWLWYFYT